MAEEQGVIEAVELDERFAAVGGGLNFVELRLRYERVLEHLMPVEVVHPFAPVPN